MNFTRNFTKIKNILSFKPDNCQEGDFAIDTNENVFIKINDKFKLLGANNLIILEEYDGVVYDLSASSVLEHYKEKLKNIKPPYLINFRFLPYNMTVNGAFGEISLSNNQIFNVTALIVDKGSNLDYRYIKMENEITGTILTNFNLDLNLRENPLNNQWWTLNTGLVDEYKMRIEYHGENCFKDSTYSIVNNFEPVILLDVRGGISNVDNIKPSVINNIINANNGFDDNRLVPAKGKIGNVSEGRVYEILGAYPSTDGSGSVTFYCYFNTPDPLNPIIKEIQTAPDAIDNFNVIYWNTTATKNSL